MRVSVLHPFFGDCPQRLAEVDLAQCRIGQFDFSHHRQQQKFGRCADRSRGTDPIHVLVYQRDFIRRQRPVTWLEFSEAR